MRWQWIWQTGVCLGISGLALPAPLAIASPQLLPQPSVSKAQAETSQQIGGSATCPEDLDALIPLLLRDLPSYANRVRQRSVGRIRTANFPGYMVLAGRPEFEPLTLGPGEYTSGLPDDEGTVQVFFTTLEREYVSNSVVNLQHYYWLFLAQTKDSGWRVVLMVSRIGGYPADEPPSPPQDSSYGDVAQSIRLWLRDCRAGMVRSS